MDLTLSEEHEALRASVEEFARKQVAPVIGEFYERGEFPYEIVAKMGAMGLFGLPIAEEYGGMGGDYFALCLALEVGEKLGAFGLTEPGGGSDAGATRTTAVLDGGDWVINGSKAFITNSGTAITAFVTVTALTATAAGPEISAIIVPSGTPGFAVAPGYSKVGWTAS